MFHFSWSRVAYSSTFRKRTEKKVKLSSIKQEEESVSMTNCRSEGKTPPVYIQIQRLEDSSIQSRSQEPASKMFLVFFCCTVAAVSAFSNSTDIIRTAVCSQGFSLSCLKLDLLGLVARAGRSGTYELFSGVSLSHNLTTIVPPGLLEAVHEGNATSQDLDTYVSSVVNDYLSSVTLSVKVLDQSAVSTARSISDRILTSLLPSQETGRRKGHGHGGAALWAAGTLATAGMAVLAAISGKAMMTSMLAMVMAGFSTLRNNNGNSHGCPNTHVIEAHARAIEEERLAAVKPIEVYTVNGPHMSASVHNLKQTIPTYMVN